MGQRKICLLFWGAFALLSRRNIATTAPPFQLLHGNEMQQSLVFEPSVLGNMKGVSLPHATPTMVSPNFALVTEFSIGTPPQKLRCLLDSGSSDLWVPSKLRQECQIEHYFHKDDSSTFKPDLVSTPQGMVLRAVKNSYGSGEIVGHTVQDTLNFGPLQIKNQSFVIAEHTTLPCSSYFDGVCGLGWNGNAKTDKPLYKRIQEQNQRAIFAFVPGHGKVSSYMVLGEVPKQSIQEDTLVWVKAEPSRIQHGSLGMHRRFWITSGGIAIHNSLPKPTRFLVDTGTNQVLKAPLKYYSAFMRSLLIPENFDRLCGRSAGNLVVCDCKIVHEKSLPPLRVYLGGRPFVLAISELFRKALAIDGSETCFLKIQPNKHKNLPEDVWMIGAVFLEHFVTIFDFDGERMGFAEPKAKVTFSQPSKLYGTETSVQEDFKDSGVGNHSAGFAVYPVGVIVSLVMLISAALRMRSHGWGSNPMRVTDQEQGQACE